MACKQLQKCCALTVLFSVVFPGASVRVVVEVGAESMMVTGRTNISSPGVVEMKKQEGAQKGDILLNVYYLGKVKLWSRLACGVGLGGAYHAAVQVFGEGSKEYSFGWNDYKTNEFDYYALNENGTYEPATGVYASEPMSDEQHTYYTTLKIGHTTKTNDEVEAIISMFQKDPSWHGLEYKMTSKNCITFCKAVLTQLLGRPCRYGLECMPHWLSALFRCGSQFKGEKGWVEGELRAHMHFRVTWKDGLPVTESKVRPKSTDSVICTIKKGSKVWVTKLEDEDPEEKEWKGKRALIGPHPECPGGGWISAVTELKDGRVIPFVKPVQAFKPFKLDAYCLNAHLLWKKADRTEQDCANRVAVEGICDATFYAKEGTCACVKAGDSCEEASSEKYTVFRVVDNY